MEYPDSKLRAIQIIHNNILLPFPVFQTEFMNDPFHPRGLKAPGYLNPRLPDDSLANTTLYIRGGGRKTVCKTGFFNNRGLLSPWNT